MNKIKPIEYQKIIQLYDNISSEKIARIYNVSRVTIARILKNNGIITGKYQTNNNKIANVIPYHIQQEIVLSYNIKTITELMQQFQLTRQQIRKILILNNIKRRQHDIEQKKYKINSNFFDNIDNEESAYFLGLLYADGCNTGKNITISLNEDDKHILDSFVKCLYIDNDRPLYFHNRKKEKQTYKNQYELTICDKNILKKLNNIGVIQKKSLLCGVPNISFNRETFKHFLRGYFDGDGNIFITKTGYIRFGLTGTLQFLQFIMNNIKRYIDININNPYQGYITKNIYDIKLGKCNDIKKICDFIYEDAHLYLKRKKEIYKKYYEN